MVSLEGKVPHFQQLQEPALATEPQSWTGIRSEHRKDWEKNGREGEASFGVYETHFNTDEHNIAWVIPLMISPKYKLSDAPFSVLPEIQKWSDVSFLGYYMAIEARKLYGINSVEREGGSAMPCPHWILFEHIKDNAETLTIVVFTELLGRQGQHLGPWPGYKFTPDMPDFNMLIGVGHSKVIAYLLIQHKAQFNINEIKSVRIWQEPSKGFGLAEHIQLSYEIGPVDDNVPAAPAKRHDSPFD
ncbi:hypothetical protein EJ08DRAFT_691250 [Tothia fuscella]|uniref:Uncharacterized protein n=1 Tax=Tothia fuscella TaxID=1048955 RepID=A0A9P4U5F5_9PEZI|nr:hypothetical protein EJ08DRAFT_691250 [Tothia fuscella]